MKICLDSGHYKGYNAGVVKGYYEGDVMWKLTNLQKKYLEEYKDVEVILTRSNISTDLSLSNRGSKAKGCDLFISNHSNACSTESVDRPVIIYPFDNKNNSYNLGDLLGKKIQVLMNTNQKHQMMTKKSTNGNYEYYGVLNGARKVNCPRYYIIEHGFHTNKKCCNWILNDANIEKLAKAEVEVIASYYGLSKKTTYPTNNVKWKNGDYNIKVRATANLNLRTGRGTNNSIIYTIPKGTVFTLGYVKDNWGSTWDFKGGVGYFCCDYIERV